MMTTKPSLSDATSRWTEYYTQSTSSQKQAAWPAEQLVIILKSNSWPNPIKSFENMRALDVGFGAGNNLIMLHSLGTQIHGVELSEQICEAVRKKLAAVEAQADLRVGTNRSIPFQNNSFDLLVSWNALHYEDNLEAFREALLEFHRVLVPEGIAVISTVGPDHMILRNAHDLGRHRKMLQGDPIRDGAIFCCFNEITDLKAEISKLFAPISAGELRFAFGAPILSEEEASSSNRSAAYLHHAWIVVAQKKSS